MEECLTPASTTSTVAPLLPQLKLLNLESVPEVITQYHPFGKVENVISTMGLVLVQSTSSFVIPDIDTPVFIDLQNGSNGLNGSNGSNGLNGSNGSNGSNGLNGSNGSIDDKSDPEYVLLGQIDDIFGSIGNPMYSVRLASASFDRSTVKINSDVYLSSNDPNTNILRVESNGGEKYCVVPEELWVL